MAPNLKQEIGFGSSVAIGRSPRQTIPMLANPEMRFSGKKTDSIFAPHQSAVITSNHNRRTRSSITFDKRCPHQRRADAAYHKRVSARDQDTMIKRKPKMKKTKTVQVVEESVIITKPSRNIAGPAIIAIIGALMTMLMMTLDLESILMTIGIVKVQTFSSTFWGSDTILDRLQFPQTGEQIAMVSGILLFVIVSIAFMVRSIAKMF